MIGSSGNLPDFSAHHSFKGVDYTATTLRRQDVEIEKHMII